MFRLQNHIRNLNTTKLQVAYQEKNLILTFNHLINVMYHLVRKTGRNLQKQQKLLPVSSNLFQPPFQVLLSQHL